MKEIRNINILAIESSCDETAAAVVHNGRKVLSNIISSQIDLHILYGGVVPEIASRKHIEKIIKRGSSPENGGTVLLRGLLAFGGNVYNSRSVSFSQFPEVRQG